MLSSELGKRDIRWTIHPNGPLSGDVMVQGSKNAVTKHMIASLLSSEPSVLSNVPDVGDVEITRSMLSSIGVQIEHYGDELTLLAGDLTSGTLPIEFSGLNRMPVLLMGPLLHRLGSVEVPLLGGDRIGNRPIDFHLQLMEAFGAKVVQNELSVSATANGRLTGIRYHLPYPSVGATESAMLTAVLAKGRSLISNVAMEPEVLELARFLQRMGALISLEPSRRMLIEGVEKLQGANHRLCGDRIEAFSYLVAGAITGGDIAVYGTEQEVMATALTILQRIGVRLEITDRYLRVLSQGTNPLLPVALETDTHPGFMTDWQAPLVALLTQASGLSVVHETVYENRFTYVPSLRGMGARIELYPNCLGGSECRFSDMDAPHSALVAGPVSLAGADVHIPDVRGGFAYAIAAAAASGSSRLSGAEHMERGYSRPAEKLSSLGLTVQREEHP